MTFETREEILRWYERQPRTLTPEFIDSIRWDEVNDHPLDPRFIPVLMYMRDIEVLTDMYHNELRWTPTGRDPVISKFMERWGVEEITHGEVINRFLEEIGVSISAEWQEQVHRAVTLYYKVNAGLIGCFANLVGRQFTGTHMAFGAVHEMTTAQAYRRMMELAGHPVLTTILKGIIREESAHTQFYWSVARLELRGSRPAQKLARFAIQNFWNPVGQGSRPKIETEYTVLTLFGDANGRAILEKTINDRIKQLPGLHDLTRFTERIGEICSGESLTVSA